MPFEDVMHRIFDRNEGTARPMSLRSLARALTVREHGHDPPQGRVEDWRRTLRRYMSGERYPSAATLLLICDVVDADPGEFPPAPSRATLRQQVAALRLENEHLAEQLRALRARRGRQ